MTRTTRTGDRRWWETKRCEVCRARIGRVRPWDERPRLLDADGHVRDARSVWPQEAGAVLATHQLTCGRCYVDRWGEALALVRRATGSGAPPIDDPVPAQP